MPLTLDQLNAASPAGFVALLDGTYEHSPWIAERAAARRPFATLAQLKRAAGTPSSSSSAPTPNWPARPWWPAPSRPNRRTNRARRA
jgi:hypothetical protein